MDSRIYIWGIPDIVFSGILSAGLGAAIALFGTWLQGRKQASLQTNQLAHDATERSREREMALRREVYFPAVEGIAKLQEYLKSYSSLSMSELERSEIIRHVWGNFNKVALIASIETIEVFDRIYLRFSELNGPFVLKHLECSQINIEIEEIQKNQGQAVVQIEQKWKVFETLDHKNAESVVFEKQIQELRDSIENRFGEIKKKGSFQNELRFEILKGIEEAVCEIELLMAEANIAIRKELNLPIDEERYLTCVKNTYHLMQKSSQTTLAAFEKQIPDLIKRLEKATGE